MCFLFIFRNWANNNVQSNEQLMSYLLRMTITVLLFLNEIIFVSLFSEDGMSDVSLKIGNDDLGFDQVGHITGATESSFTFHLALGLHAQFVRLEATNSSLQLCEVQIYAVCEPGKYFECCCFNFQMICFTVNTKSKRRCLTEDRFEDYIVLK